MKTLLQEGVAILEGKKIKTVSSKMSEAEITEYDSIGLKEDRTRSYVIRNLALRGYLEYLRDGSLKLSENDVEEAPLLIEKFKQLTEKSPVDNSNDGFVKPKGRKTKELNAKPDSDQDEQLA